MRSEPKNINCLNSKYKYNDIASRYIYTKYKYKYNDIASRYICILVYVGFVLLLTLMVLVTIKDVSRLF